MAAEAAEVVAAGGTAVILTEDARRWRRQRLPKKVRVVELSGLADAPTPQTAEWVMLFRTPRMIVRALDRGPSARWATRAERAYTRRLAARVVRGRYLLPARQPVSGRPPHRGAHDDVRRMLIMFKLLGGARFDLVVAGDPASLPLAELLAGPDAGGSATPRFAYSVDCVLD